ncbi:MAG: ThiF family adenylyltransferase [bacterium]
MIHRQALDAVFSSVKPEKSLPIYGLVRKEENLAYILNIGDEHQYLPFLGIVRFDYLFPEEGILCGHVQNGNLTLYYRENKKWQMTEQLVIDQQDVYKRTPFARKLMDRLKESVVAIIGLGSGGSRMAVGLARSGVSRFRLADPDRLAVENVSRHECTLLDLERYKVEAVKERMFMINPGAEVLTFPCDVFNEEQAKESMFTGADLVISSTDRKAVQMKVNEECFNRNIVGLFTGCYDEARAGEILYVVPGKTIICYECLRGGSVQQRGPRKYDYSLARYHSDYMGEPGLNAAINQVTDIAEQYAIALLLRKEQCEISGLLDHRRNLLFISSGLGKGFYYLRNTSCFTRPFEVIQPTIKEAWRSCSVCRQL